MKALWPRWLLLTAVLLAVAPSPAAEAEIVIAEVRTFGNELTRKDIILKYCAFSEGDVMTEKELHERIKKTERNLKNTFFYKRVNVYNLPRSDPGRAVVLVTVRERTPWSISAYFWKVSIANENIGGRALRVGITVGENRFDLGFRQPWFLGSGFIVGGRVYFETGHKVNVENYAGVPGEYFSVETFGTGVNVGYNIGSYDSFGAEVVWERRNFFDLSVKTDPFGRFGVGPVTDLVCLRPYFVFNRKDMERTPQLGFYAEITGELADDVFGAYAYRQVDCDVRFYVTPWGISTVAVRGQSGYSTAGTPYFRWFNVEGLDGVRTVGYNNMVGDKAVAGSIELRRSLFRLPVLDGWVSVAAFLDAGRTWDPGEKPALEELAYGYGPAIRIHVRDPFVFDVRAEATFSKDFKVYLFAAHAF